jgi:Zn-dependent protease
MPTIVKQILSVVLSFVLYAFLLNWQLAFVIIGSVVWHEFGHILSAKYLGLKTGGMFFIPGLGGISFVEEAHRKYSDMAAVVLGGPAAGTILSILCYLGYLATGSMMLGHAALIGVFLNLFNCVPVSMLDAGQLLEAIVFSINELAGVIFLAISYAVGGYVLWHFNPLIAVVSILFGLPYVIRVWNKYKLNKKGLGDKDNQPERMNGREIMISLCSYLLIVGVLLFLFFQCSNHGLHIQDLVKK